MEPIQAGMQVAVRAGEHLALDWGHRDTAYGCTAELHDGGGSRLWQRPDRS
jgi:hypothetical protein